MKWLNCDRMCFLIILFITLSLMSVGVSAKPTRLGRGIVQTIAFSPDGTILTASHRTDLESDIYSTQVIIFWDPQTQEQISTLEIDNILSMTFSPDGTLLASGGGDNKILLWDVAGQSQVGLMQSTTLYGVNSLAFSPDGKTLASSGTGSTLICLWDVQTGQQLGTLSGHTGQSVLALVFSPDGRFLFSGGHRDDEAIRVWDVQTFEQVGELVGHLDITFDLAVSPDYTILASAGGYKDKAVYLWDMETQNQIGVLGGHSAHVLSIAFSPNGKFLASTVIWDDTIHFWDIEKQEQVGIFEGHDATDSGIKSVITFSPDRKWLACGSENGIELWELDQLPREMLTELMLMIMNEYYYGTINAELAWDLLVEVQTAIAALDSDNPDDAIAAMNDLKSLINEGVNPRLTTIKTVFTQQANEIIIIVTLGS